MPDTRLILHVKGTASETAEMPREAVKEAISQGKISQSQLIWSPIENTWKQVKELPELLPSDRMILHVPGTEAETRELSKQAVQEGIADGTIPVSQLIWRPEENTWKQVKDIPELVPAPPPAPPAKPLAVTPPARPVLGAVPGVGPMIKLNLPSSSTSSAIASPPRLIAPTAAKPKVAVAPMPQAASASVPKVKAASTASAKPAVKAPAPILVQSTGDLHVKHEEGMHFMKWVCLVLGLLIAAVVGTNYFLVDKPLVSGLSETRYGIIPVYAHLGAFVQPNVVVIHLPKSSSIIPSNLTKVLVEIARNTPKNPVTHQAFGRVALTNSWTAQYSFSGSDWEKLSQMTRESSDSDREDFIMETMGDAGGQSLMPESTLNEDLLKAKREEIWNKFVQNFAGA
jgi:hypothetical protein